MSKDDIQIVAKAKEEGAPNNSITHGTRWPLRTPPILPSIEQLKQLSVRLQKIAEQERWVTPEIQWYNWCVYLGSELYDLVYRAALLPCAVVWATFTAIRSSWREMRAEMEDW